MFVTGHHEIIAEIGRIFKPEVSTDFLGGITGETKAKLELQKDGFQLTWENGYSFRLYELHGELFAQFRDSLGRETKMVRESLQSAARQLYKNVPIYETFRELKQLITGGMAPYFWLRIQDRPCPNLELTNDGFILKFDNASLVKIYELGGIIFGIYRDCGLDHYVLFSHENQDKARRLYDRVVDQLLAA